MSIKPSSYAGWVAVVAIVSLMIGCDDRARNQNAAPSDEVTRRPADDGPDGPGTGNLPGSIDSHTGITADQPARDPGPTEADGRGIVVFLGTSLTAGYGLSPAQAFPALIERRVREEGLPFRIINAGVSGETSAGALRRVDWLLQQPFDVLVIETGANDMLRGNEPAATEADIQAIVDRVRSRRPETRILLAGMLAMPNLGREYGERFEALYPRVAERNDITLIPFLLDGVAGERSLNLSDGVHPNAQGQRIVAETVWETLEPVLREESARP
jgi:acyl-CoA thioesterase-1